MAEPISMTLMISAAVVSSLRALRIRPAGSAGVSPGSPLTSGITTTPVSKPDSPRARAGNTSSDAPRMASGDAWASVTADVQSENVEGFASTWRKPSATTTALSPM